MDNNISKGLILNENILLGTSSDELAGIFATDASKHNHSVAYIVPNSTKIILEPNVFELSYTRMQEANNYLLRANKNIHRTWPTYNNDLNNKLKRDSYLVRWCQKVYAVGVFTNDSNLLKIAGDLAWPAQMYVDRFLYDRELLSTCELYMFDLNSEYWFNWNTKWTRIVNIPQPTGIYAVIGSDKLSRSAKIAIDELWKD